jgi:dsDNA-specific endonuclease/ATPase MutS2
MQREEIGFSFVMDRLEVMTPFGLEERNNIRPFRKEEKHKLLLELNNIEVIVKEILKNKELLGEIERAFCRVKDIRNTVKRCKEKVTLDDVELYEIKYFSILVEEIMSAYKKFNLVIEGIKFNALTEAVNILDPENKKIPTFYIYDCYSDRLKAVRAEKRKLEEMIFKASGNEEMIRLKDERLNIVVQEEEEELSIRKELTKRLSQHALQIEENIEAIGRLDFLSAASTAPAA